MVPGPHHHVSERDLFDRPVFALDNHDGVMATGALTESVAAKAKLADRDVILEIGGEKVRDLAHFKEIYERLTNAEPKKVVARILKNGRDSRLVVLNLSDAKNQDGGAK